MEFMAIESTSRLELQHPITQRVHVGGIWYILRAQRGSHIPTLGPKYTPYSYMDPLGNLKPINPEPRLFGTSHKPTC